MCLKKSLICTYHEYFYDDIAIFLPVLRGCFSNLTNRKGSWRRDLLNEADISPINNGKTPCHAACIIWNWYIEYSNTSVLGCPFPCACRMRLSGFHTLSDITWSVVYNAVPAIRLAGSVSVEWFLAVNFQITVHTRSDGCHLNTACITNYIS